MRRTLLPIAFLFSAPTFAQLVINEVDYDQPGTDSAEYIELKNTGNVAFPLNNVSIVLVNGTSGNPAVYNVIASATWPDLAAGAYFTLCGDPTAGCDDVLPVASNAVQNGPSDAIVLIDMTDSTVIDMLAYEGDVADCTEGQGTLLGDDNVNVGRSFGRYPDGADTDNNRADFIPMCGTLGATNLPDTAACTSPSGIHEQRLAPALTVFADPGNDRVWMYCESEQATPITFEVFAVDGSLQAARAFGTGTKATWNWSTGGQHGRVYLVRATTAHGVTARRIVMP